MPEKYLRDLISINTKIILPAILAAVFLVGAIFTLFQQLSALQKDVAILSTRQPVEIGMQEGFEETDPETDPEADQEDDDEKKTA